MIESTDKMSTAVSLRFSGGGLRFLYSFHKTPDSFYGYSLMIQWDVSIIVPLFAQSQPLGAYHSVGVSCDSTCNLQLTNTFFVGIPKKIQNT